MTQRTGTHRIRPDSDSDLKYGQSSDLAKCSLIGKDNNGPNNTFCSSRGVWHDYLLKKVIS